MIRFGIIILMLFLNLQARADQAYKCLLTVNNAQIDTLIIPLPEGSLVYTINAVTTSGKPRHFFIGMTIGDSLFQINLLDADHTVQDGSYARCTVLSSINLDISAAQPKFKITLGDPLIDDPVIGLSCSFE